MGCCGRQNKAKRRYKRLCDGIFPLDPSDGIINANMQKLTYYAVVTPNRLNKISKYLWNRLSRDLSRGRKGYAQIAMKALDQLMQACHSNLNLFVEYYLRMVERLLETNDPDMMILGTSSFVKFAAIEEETPSYHRRYDFFVSQFSNICLNQNKDAATRERIRIAGLRGLRAIVVKTVDNLYVNIWADMGKVVPALLYNMNAAAEAASHPAAAAAAAASATAAGASTAAVSTTVETAAGVEMQTMHKASPELLNDEDDRAKLAQYCLQDIAGRADFNSLKQILVPMMEFLDQHDSWRTGTFAHDTFRCIMYAVQSQFFSVPISELLLHLNAHANSPADIKAGVVSVTTTVVGIAKGATGPSVLKAVDVLLRHLRMSVSVEVTSQSESALQNAIVVSVGVLARDLPVYQQVEVLTFLLAKLPSDEDMVLVESQHTHADDVVRAESLAVEKFATRRMLMRCLLQVARHFSHTGTQLDTTFTSSLADPLFRACVSPDQTMRVLGIKILPQLLHRIHLPASQAHTSRHLMTINSGARAIQKRLHWVMFESAQRIDNTDQDVFTALFDTHVSCLALFGLQELLDLVRLLFALQEVIVARSRAASGYVAEEEEEVDDDDEEEEEEEEEEEKEKEEEVTEEEAKEKRVAKEDKEEEASKTKDGETAEADKKKKKKKHTNKKKKAVERSASKMIAISHPTNVHEATVHAFIASCLRIASDRFGLGLLRSYVVSVMKAREDIEAYDAPQFSARVAGALASSAAKAAALLNANGATAASISTTGATTTTATTTAASTASVGASSMSASGGGDSEDADASSANMSPLVLRRAPESVDAEHAADGDERVTHEATESSTTPLFRLADLVDAVCADARVTKAFPDCHAYLLAPYMHKGGLEGSSQRRSRALQVNPNHPHVKMGANASVLRAASCHQPDTPLLSSAPHSPAFALENGPPFAEATATAMRAIAGLCAPARESEETMVAKANEKQVEIESALGHGDAETFATMSFNELLDLVEAQSAADAERAAVVRALVRNEPVDLTPRHLKKVAEKKEEEKEEEEEEKEEKEEGEKKKGEGKEEGAMEASGSELKNEAGEDVVQLVKKKKKVVMMMEPEKEKEEEEVVVVEEEEEGKEAAPEEKTQVKKKKRSLFGKKAVLVIEQEREENVVPSMDDDQDEEGEAHVAEESADASESALETTTEQTTEGQAPEEEEEKEEEEEEEEEDDLESHETFL